MFEMSFKFRVFGLNIPGHFRDFLGDHFARVESSGDQNWTMFILHFHVFVCICDPPTSHGIEGFRKPFETLPWDHAQMIERKTL